MSFKVKNLEIQNVLIGRPEVFSNRKLPVKMIYWFSRLERELHRNFKIFNEERTKLLEDYCSKDEKGKPKMTDNRYDFDDDGQRIEVMKMVNELLDLETEIRIDKIKIEIDQLQDAISADEMTLLEPFVEFIEEKKEKG
jgi:hypothetical protein